MPSNIDRSSARDRSKTDYSASAGTKTGMVLNPVSEKLLSATWLQVRFIKPGRYEKDSKRPYAFSNIRFGHTFGAMKRSVLRAAAETSRFARRREGEDSAAFCSEGADDTPADALLCVD